MFNNKKNNPQTNVSYFYKDFYAIANIIKAALIELLCLFSLIMLLLYVIFQYLSTYVLVSNTALFAGLLTSTSISPTFHPEVLANVTLVRLLQFLNTQPLILVTPLGIVIDAKLLQFWNIL
jgi:hypothetical protein